jgi:Zn-dependent protease
MANSSGTIRLFRFSGITVSMHWTWLLAAIYEIIDRRGAYSTEVWNALEYVAVFVIITMHEFGHSFACRSVGGRADQIMIWPLGGIAVVDPPPRPGATLWSIAAGPLVNVALAPVLAALTVLIPASTSADAHALMRSVTYIDLGLLAFNLVPVYPLDGGQILGALLWFVLGRARSLAVTAIMGLAGVVAIGWLAFTTFSPWLVIIALFVARQCIVSLRFAKSLNRLREAERRAGFACPSCHSLPPIGSFWTCSSCGNAFDVFDPAAATTPPPSEVTALSLSARLDAAAEAQIEPRCPVCHASSDTSRCLQCDASAPIADWKAAAVAATWPAARIPGVTRVRQPRRPSIAPIVNGVLVGVAGLMGVFLAVVAFNLSSRAANAEESAFMRHIGTGIAMLALVPIITAVVLLLRYRRSQKTYDLAMLRFHDERDRDVGV